MGSGRASIRLIAGFLIVFVVMVAVSCSRPTPTAAPSDVVAPPAAETLAPGPDQDYPRPTEEEASPQPAVGDEGYPPPPTQTPVQPAYAGPEDTPTAETTG